MERRKKNAVIITVAVIILAFVIAFIWFIPFDFTNFFFAGLYGLPIAIVAAAAANALASISYNIYSAGTRSSEILYKLFAAKTHLKKGNVNDAILDLYLAVNATISLILETEGLNSKRPDGRELPMRERFKLLAEREWVSWNHARYFRRLQELRNRIEHSPELIHVPLTTASEAEELLRFHENFIRTSLGKLGPLLIKIGEECPKLSDMDPSPSRPPFTSGSTINFRACVENIGLEEVKLKYSAFMLFEVIIRDETGRPVWVYSDTLHDIKERAKKDKSLKDLFVVEEEEIKPGYRGLYTSKNMWIPLVYTRGPEKGKPLPPGIYTLTVYLIATVKGYPPRTVDGIKAYAVKSVELAVSPHDAIGPKTHNAERPVPRNRFLRPETLSDSNKKAGRFADCLRTARTSGGRPLSGRLLLRSGLRFRSRRLLRGPFYGLLSSLGLLCRHLRSAILQIASIYDLLERPHNDHRRVQSPSNLRHYPSQPSDVRYHKPSHPTYKA
jgi:hypothetical protein